jgi:hypothetical protein
MENERTPTSSRVQGRENFINLMDIEVTLINSGQMRRRKTSITPP